MAHLVKCFRSGNTLRISLHTQLRAALCALPADVLLFRTHSDGNGTVENLSHTERTKQRRQKK
mgnify:CR=1 FL=1